jgi:hypothetical protein
MAVTSPFNAPAGDRRNGAPVPQSTATGAPPPAMSGDRLPRPPRRRRPGFAALAVLLVVGAAAAAGLLAMRLDQRTPVLVAARDLEVGQEITRGDLAEVKVSAAGLSLIPSSQVDTVLGQYVTQQIPAGRPLDQAMMDSSGLLKEGYVAIGVPLKAGSAPASGLQSGDRVKVVRAVDGEGTLLSEDAVVGAVSTEEDGGRFGGGNGGDPVVTIIVRDTKAANGRPSVTTQIGAAALAGHIVLELVERGTTASGEG